LVAPRVAHAVSFPSASDLGLTGNFAKASTAIQTGWNAVIIAAGIIFMALLLFGGVQYLIAAGNDEQAKKARQTILDAVIGIALVVFAWPLGILVLNVLGVGSNLGVEQSTPQLSTSQNGSQLSAGQLTPSDSTTTENAARDTTAEQIPDQPLTEKLRSVEIVVTGKGGLGQTVSVTRIPTNDVSQNGVLDSDGRYTTLLAPGDYEIVIGSEHFVRTLQPGTGDESWRFQLNSSGPVTPVTLVFLDNAKFGTDQVGTQIPNYGFSLYLPGENPTQLVSSQTDQNGEYTGQLPAGQTVEIRTVDGNDTLDTFQVPDSPGQRVSVLVNTRRVFHRISFWQSSQTGGTTNDPTRATNVPIKLVFTYPDGQTETTTETTSADQGAIGFNVKVGTKIDAYYQNKHVCIVHVPPINAEFSSCLIN